jgi:glycosyltransferase involved in cell wall biosynthesis
MARTKNPVVSVIIPTFNRAGYIAQAISSVLTQKFHDVEILVIDDGSEDETEAVVGGIADDRVHYVKILHSGHPSVPRNVGIEASTGKYIAFLDSDDYWLPEKLSLQVPLMEKHSEINISFANVITFDEFSEREIELRYRFSRNGNPRFRLLFRNFIPVITVIIQKAFLDNHNLRFNEQPYARALEDYDLWLRCAFEGGIFRFINRALAKHRLHPNQISHESSNNHRLKEVLRNLPIQTFPHRIARELALIKQSVRRSG